MTCLLCLYVSTYTRIVNKSNSNKDENNSDSGNCMAYDLIPEGKHNDSIECSKWMKQNDNILYRNA